MTTPERRQEEALRELRHFVAMTPAAVVTGRMFNLRRDLAHALLDALSASEQRAEEAIRERDALEMEVRQMLWLGHGHQGLYGDDGEMQCGECLPVVDYKRAPLDQVRQAAFKAKVAGLTSTPPEPPQ